MIVKPNDTMRFILPMLYTKDYNNDFFFNDYLIGTYTSDINYPEMDNKLLLVYQYVPEAEYITFEECLFDIPTYSGKYIYEREDILVYAFDIPEEFVVDYKNIGNRIFSEISASLKLNISKFWNVESTDELFKIITGELDYLGENFSEQIFNIEDYDYNDLYEQISDALDAEENRGRDSEAEEILV